MMNRPISIILISGISLFSPLLLFLIYSYTEMNEQTLLKWFILSVLFSTSGFGLWKIKKWAYFLFLITSGITVGLEIQSLIFGSEFNQFTTFTSLILVSLSLSQLFRKHIFSPYFNPNLNRWARAADRYSVKVMCEFSVDNQTRSGELLDLSQSGCFATIFTEVHSGEILTLKINLKHLNLEAKAKVIWKCPDPSGYGLMFIDLNRKKRKDIKKILKYLKTSLGKDVKINQGLPKVHVA